MRFDLLRGGRRRSPNFKLFLRTLPIMIQFKATLGARRSTKREEVMTKDRRFELGCQSTLGSIRLAHFWTDGMATRSHLAYFLCVCVNQMELPRAATNYGAMIEYLRQKLRLDSDEWRSLYQRSCHAATPINFTELLNWSPVDRLQCSGSHGPPKWPPNM